jgi:hypothetical protein
MQLGPDGIAELRKNALELEASAYKHGKKFYGKTEPCFPREK